MLHGRGSGTRGRLTTHRDLHQGCEDTKTTALVSISMSYAALMDRGIFNSPVVGIVNRVFVALIEAPLVGRIVGRGLVVIRYVGRRSGKTFAIPVGYRRSGNTVTINVAAPDSKNWWRNFLGDGGPITLLNLDGRDRIGHAVANRDARGRVSVTARLDP
jgi:hypothetical protein